MTNTNQIIIRTPDGAGISAGEIAIAGRDQDHEPPRRRPRTGVNR